MNGIAFAIVAGSAVAFAVLVYIAFMSGRHYSVEDTESHASDYANTIKEGHGPVTILLWIAYGSILAWTIYYFIAHASEFTAIG